MRALFENFEAARTHADHNARSAYLPVIEDVLAACFATLLILRAQVREKIQQARLRSNKVPAFLPNINTCGVIVCMNERRKDREAWNHIARMRLPRCIRNNLIKSRR